MLSQRGGTLVLEVPRRAPRLAGAHPRWRSTLASTFDGFRVLSNPDPALFLLFAYSRLGWAWAIAKLEASRAWQLYNWWRLEAYEPGVVEFRLKVWLWSWLEAQ